MSRTCGEVDQGMPMAEYNAVDVGGRPARRLKRLRVIREARAMSQAELAEQSELSRATIVSLESGRAGAQYATIRRIAEVLGVEPAELMEPNTDAYYSAAIRYVVDHNPTELL